MKTLTNQYKLLDSGCGRKLEQFGPFLLDRPCSQAVWKPSFADKHWPAAHATFTRETDNRWEKQAFLPEAWKIEVAGIQFKISPTDFGHLGIFPEQQRFWEWMQEYISGFTKNQEINVLNLFAYSGGSTLAAAKAGASVCHLDASKGMVAWARENATFNGLQEAPIRWIIEDVTKFLFREIRRGKRYDAIILDPPTFGRGSKGEVFKIEEDIIPLLELCRQLLTPEPLFMLFSCHTPGFSPQVMHNLLHQLMKNYKGHVDCGEMVLSGAPDVYELPSGTYARWQHA